MIEPMAEDIGREVVYQPSHGPREDGVVTGFNEAVVFVRYREGYGSKATKREDLHWLGVIPHEFPAPKPFDPGYDYEADKDIVERLKTNADNFRGMGPYRHAMAVLLDEAAGEIRALRLLVKNRERTIDDLIAERKADENET